MENWEACKKLSDLIIKNGEPGISAYMLESFIGSLDRGETPAMSLVLAKKVFDLEIENLLI